MKQPELNRRLTSLDAAFLNLERKECPMHIGSTSVFAGKIDLANLKKHIEDRLHLVPRFLQKVVPDPFNIAHPTWEFDDDFDIQQHVFEFKSEEKINAQTLPEIAGKCMTGVLKRHKPLWEIFVINDYEGDESALIMKVHHCMADGISGVDLIKIIFDISPEPAKVEKQEIEKPRNRNRSDAQIFRFIARRDAGRNEPDGRSAGRFDVYGFESGKSGNGGNRARSRVGFSGDFHAAADSAV